MSKHGPWVVDRQGKRWLHLCHDRVRFGLHVCVRTCAHTRMRMLVHACMYMRVRAHRCGLVCGLASILHERLSLEEILLQSCTLAWDR